jgi:hypothetical protein
VALGINAACVTSRRLQAITGSANVLGRTKPRRHVRACPALDQVGGAASADEIAAQAVAGEALGGRSWCQQSSGTSGGQVQHAAVILQ